MGECYMSVAVLRYGSPTWHMAMRVCEWVRKEHLWVCYAGRPRALVLTLCRPARGKYGGWRTSNSRSREQDIRMGSQHVSGNEQDHVCVCCIAATMPAYPVACVHHRDAHHHPVVPRHQPRPQPGVRQQRQAHTQQHANLGGKDGAHVHRPSIVIQKNEVYDGGIPFPWPIQADS